MELFKKAKVVRFRGHHDKYLLAGDDEESVCQDRNGSVWNARWSVEFVDKKNVLLFKSCFGKYLTASHAPFLLGMTGRKVVQTFPNRLDTSLEWEPIREGFKVRLKTHDGHFLRANGGLPPWRNSITHDIPLRSSRQDWIVWNVDILEIRDESPKSVFRPEKIPKPISRTENASEPNCRSEKVPEQNCRSEKVMKQNCGSENIPESNCRSESESTIEIKIPKLSKQESDDSIECCSPMKTNGRKIHYSVANGDDDNDDSIEEILMMFKGMELKELIEKLEEETGIKGIVVCSRNPLNRELHPLRLQPPPNNTSMHVVVVPSSSKLARDCETPQSPTAA